MARKNVVIADTCSDPCALTPSKERRLSSLLEPQRTFVSAANLFGVLAEKSRLRILSALRGGDELCVCEVACLLSASTSVASHHLRLMKDAGVLANRSEGKLVYYRIADSRVEALLATALDGDVESLERIHDQNATSSSSASDKGVSYG